MSHRHADWDYALTAADEERYDLLRPYKDEAWRRREAIYEAQAREKAEREEKERMQQWQEKARPINCVRWAHKLQKLQEDFKTRLRGKVSGWMSAINPYRVGDK